MEHTEHSERSARQQSVPSVCATCDGSGYVERAPQDSRVIHHEPCPDCAGSFSLARDGQAERDALIAALVQEYADVLARRGPWGLTGGQNAMVARALEDGARSALLHVAERLGVSNLHAMATERARRGEHRAQP